MPTPEEFLQATQWGALSTLGLAALTALAFLLGWGIRFRLVGVTGFTAVLTVGFLGLSFEPFTTTVVPGAVPFSTVYDSGAAQVVVKVPADISESALEATLRQAASNLFKPYRLGRLGETPTIRARTILHQDDGVSQLVYLGAVQPDPQDAQGVAVTLYPDQLALLAEANHA